MNREMLVHGPRPRSAPSGAPLRLLKQNRMNEERSLTLFFLLGPHRPDRLLTPDTHPRTGKPRAGFETVGQCQAEDQSRALALRATAQAIIASSKGKAAATAVNLDPQAAVNLADRLQAGAGSGRP